MAENPHFVDPTSTTAFVLNTILELAGPNFIGPYNASAQPFDTVAANAESLLQFNLPGGAFLSGSTNPGLGGNIGAAINSVLSSLGPVVSAYAFILPILGVIRGILEVICALMNPFAVVRAVIRLFKKWLPPFIAMFPAIAGIILILSIIKLIIAIVFFFMTEIYPVLELIRQNILLLRRALTSPDDLNESQLDAVKLKLTKVLETLLQKLGILSVFLPLIELVFTILGLASGFPCKGGNTDVVSAVGPTLSVNPESDSPCCDELCPDELLNPPSGKGTVTEREYENCGAGFVWKLSTGNNDVASLEQYQQNTEDQSKCVTDGGLKYAKHPGGSGSRSTIKVKLTNKRGSSAIFPVLLISGTDVMFVDSGQIGSAFLGSGIDYEIKPDYDMLLAEGIISVNCHPDVSAAADAVSDNFNLGDSVLNNNPEVGGVLEDAKSYQEDVFGELDRVDEAIKNIGQLGADDAGDELDEDVAKIFDDALNNIESAGENILNASTSFVSSLNGILDVVINRNTKGNASLLTVDKSIVKADAKDFATISVVVRNVGGSLLLRSVPDAVNVDVQINTDVGEISEQQLDTSTGVITATIKSAEIGAANITASVNGEPIAVFDGEDETEVVRVVNFVSDAVLPTRRVLTKKTTTGKVTSNISEND